MGGRSFATTCLSTTVATNTHTRSRTRLAGWGSRHGTAATTSTPATIANLPSSACAAARIRGRAIGAGAQLILARRLRQF